MAEIEHDPGVPQPTEAIHMPEPSYLPVALALGITIALLGILGGLPMLVIGLVITIAVLVRWIRSARDEMSSLPLEHH